MTHRILYRLSFPTLTVAILSALFVTAETARPSHAQEAPAFAVQGYITDVRSGSFDVNGRRVLVQPGTTFGMENDTVSLTNSPLRGELRAGAYVFVNGAYNGHARATLATRILFRNDLDRKLSGLGVVDRVISAGAEPVYEADGYRIRVTHGTQVSFTDGYKSLADVGPNTWLRYEGKRDKAGDLVASRLVCFPAKPVKFKGMGGWAAPDMAFRPAGSPTVQKAVLRQGGDDVLGGKVEIGGFAGLGGWHTVSTDRSLQERVNQVGMSVIPEYQKQLADNDPSKIHFRFYAVDGVKMRSEINSTNGLILIPAEMVARLRSDDQLAAVLADGVAYNLQRQLARSVSADNLLNSIEAAGEATIAFVPGVDIATAVGTGIASHKLAIAMEKQRGRVALALLAAAGYDPRQAPEAWRLLDPKRLPANTANLKYPDLSGYQLGILNLQYRNIVAPARDGAQSAEVSLVAEP